MRAIKLKVVIDETHRLQLDLPADTPTGEAEVIVLLTPTTSAEAPSTSLAATLAEIGRRPRPRLSAEEVERWIEEERNAR